LTLANPEFPLLFPLREGSRNPQKRLRKDLGNPHFLPILPHHNPIFSNFSPINSNSFPNLSPIFSHYFFSYSKFSQYFPNKLQSIPLKGSSEEMAWGEPGFGEKWRGESEEK
jgi:hypothetical protein